MKFARPRAGFQCSASRSQAKVTGPSNSQRHRQDILRNTPHESASASSTWQSADVPDTSHSKKRSLDTDGSSTSVNKQARVNDAQDVKTLLAMIREKKRENSYLRSKLQIITQGQLNVTLGTANSPQNSADSDILADLGCETPYDPEDLQSGPPSTYVTPCNSSPPLSIKSLPMGEDSVESDSPSTLPVCEDGAVEQSVSSYSIVAELS